MRIVDKILLKLKSNHIEFPGFLGQILSNVPFSYRPGIGKIYEQQSKAILNYGNLSEDEKKEYIYRQFSKVFNHAYHNVPFYSKLYKTAGITPSIIKDFTDISKVPLVTKQDLLNTSIEERSSFDKDRFLVNTGGSSGKTLSLYMDPKRLGNEWAHIHYFWKKMGYSPNMLKLSFDGRVSFTDNPIRYDAIRHSLRYNIYENPDITGEYLMKFISKRPVFYLHGYPSAIYNFAIYCKDKNVDLLNLLKKNLKGAFLNSEFPSPHYRDVIESVFNISTQSFYGHTETCVIAYETEKYQFMPMQTYGLAEAIKKDDNYHLVGTSYFNFQSPLIRYDTADIISNVNYDDGILHKFEIKEGREGDFIIDRNGNRITLTGLIFGRHHKLFNEVNHIQVYQKDPGTAIIYIVPSNPSLSEDKIGELFDSSNILMDFEFKMIDQPILTSSGKLNLLIKTL